MIENTPVLFVCVLLALTGVSSRTQEGMPQPSMFGDLPSGVVFAPPNELSTDELVESASLIQVTRWTEKGGIGLVRSCYDEESGAPLVFLVESGRFDFAVTEPGPGVGGMPSQGVPTLFRGNDRRPVLVVPGSTIEMSPGDVVLTPNGTECSLLSRPGDAAGTVVLVQVRFFPSGPFPLRDDEYTTIENFDVNLGVVSANPPPPPAIVSGVLTLQPGARLDLSRSNAAVAFSVRAGSLEVTVDTGMGIIRRKDADAPRRSVPIPVRTGIAVDHGDMVYLPPESNTVLRNVGHVPVSTFVVSVLPDLWRPPFPAAPA